jgi:hypothetical protein
MKLGIIGVGAAGAATAMAAVLCALVRELGQTGTGPSMTVRGHRGEQTDTAPGMISSVFSRYTDALGP